MESIICKFVFIYLIGYKLNKSSNETESMLKESTNLTMTDGSLHETNIDTAEINTLFGNIT